MQPPVRLPNGAAGPRRRERGGDYHTHLRRSTAVVLKSLLLIVFSLAGCGRPARVASVFPAEIAGPSATSAPHGSNSAAASSRERGVAAYLDGDLRLAERLLRSAVTQSHRDTTALFYLARVSLARGTPEGRQKAESALETLTLLRPDDLEALRALGELRADQGYFSNAKRSFSKLVGREDCAPPVLVEMARMAERDYWRFQRRELRDAAVDYYERALRGDPSLEEPHVRLAVLAFEEDSLVTGARHVEALRARYPASLTTILLDGVRCERFGDFETGESRFREAIARMFGFDRLVYEDPRFLEPDSTSAFSTLTAAFVDEVPRDPGFWQRRDPSPGTPVNERFVVHAARVAMADFLYGREEKRYRGWDTAPGEFYIRYGKPLRRVYDRMVSLQTFRIGGRLETVRFVDYTMSDRFYHPIEYSFGVIPLHARLRVSEPDDSGLSARLPSRPALASASWFLGASGEPRLEISIADSLVPRPWSVSVLDSAWVEVCSGAEVISPRALPAGARGELRGVFVSELMPGEGAVHVLGTLGKGTSVSLEAGPPPRAGFALSDVQLGFSGESGFLPNPGYPYDASTGLSVRFEVYGTTLDPSGLGYLQLELSIVPESTARSGLSGVFFGPRTKPYVASALEEVVSRATHERVIAIDLSRLEPGPYRLVVKATDEMRRESVTQAAAFRVAASE